MSMISQEKRYSLNTIDYWMRKYDIKRRTRSEANYLLYNPSGDPFTLKRNLTPYERQLFGLGLGLYWGEGTKTNKNSVRIGNSDPGVILQFINFLDKIYSVPRDKLKFGLQLFSDCDKDDALNHWCKSLSIKPDQFYKIHVTISGKIGTYRRKNKYGVGTLYYHNTKLQRILVDHINNMPR